MPHRETVMAYTVVKALCIKSLIFTAYIHPVLSAITS